MIVSILREMRTMRSDGFKKKQDESKVGRESGKYRLRRACTLTRLTSQRLITWAEGLKAINKARSHQPIGLFLFVQLRRPAAKLNYYVFSDYVL